MRLASAPSSLRIFNAAVPLIHPLPSGVTSTCASSRDIPRQSTAIISSRHSSESHIRALPVAVPVVARSVCTPPLLREKSGGPLKSLLKVRRTQSRGSLSVVTDPVNSNSSNSALATPAHKDVRFRSQPESRSRACEAFPSKAEASCSLTRWKPNRYQWDRLGISPIYTSWPRR